MTSKAVYENLETLRNMANRRTHSPLTTTDWSRLICWHIGDADFYWRVVDGQLIESSSGSADIILTCGPETLERLAGGELPLFIAMWATGEVAFEASFADAFRLGYIFLSDRRGRRIVFLAHCFLNANTRFPGGCAFSGATEPLIQVLLDSGVGIVQMPCPEFLCMGLEKHLYGEMPEKELRDCFRAQAKTVIDQAEEYLANGYEIAGIIGMNPSPSCGVEITKGKGTMLGVNRDTSEVEDSGVFIEELKLEALDRGLIDLPFFGVRRMLPGESGLEERLEEVGRRLNK